MNVSGEELFDMFKDTNFTIAPWIEPDFWSDMKNDKFAISYIDSLYKCLLKRIKEMSNASETLSQEIRNILVTILHVTISYHKAFLEEYEFQKNVLERIGSVKNQTLQYFSVFIRNLYLPNNFNNVIDRIVDEQTTSIFNETLSIFSLIGLMQFVHSNVDLGIDVLKAIVQKLNKNIKYSSSQILLHLLYCFLCFFPQTDHIILDDLFEALKSLFSKASPVSDMASHMRMMLKKSIKYPGYIYFSILSEFAEANPAFDGKCHLIFNSTDKYLMNYLYSANPDNTSYGLSIMNFVKFFIAFYFKANPPESSTDLISIIQNLQMNEKCLGKLAKQFKLDESPNHETKHPWLSLPSYRLLPIRLSLNCELSTKLTTSFNQKQDLFCTPSGLIFSNQLFKPLVKYLESHPDEIYYENKILIVGDDFVLSHFLISLVSAIQENLSLSNVSFTIYFVPSGNSRVADFISLNDPAYRKFIYPLYNIVNNILPKFDENSNVSFSFCNHLDHLQYDNDNVWFKDPSPSHLFQFGIQYYLHFAKNVCNINIWKCSLHFETKHLVVPLFTNINVISIKKAYQVYYTDVGNSYCNFTIEKQQGLSIWCSNKEYNVSPTDKWLVATIPTKSKSKEIKYSMITSLKFLDQNKTKEPFDVIIDGIKYGPINGFAIDSLIDIPEFPQKMRIATFSQI